MVVRVFVGGELLEGFAFAFVGKCVGAGLEVIGCLLMGVGAWVVRITIIRTLLRCDLVEVERTEWRGDK